ncbi:hypothetical protein [Knoellia koreensis]|uniref:Uncharacterized protein n=1 Tax=Knoellia koreensis TaxID=2730921 RepID=A0A849HFN9_9MICO|nr:hypothetical protein [Knoellia sp. DB2414S]NNM46755.1 hypothetical protein [Knoellia sp. DB2414S]
MKRRDGRSRPWRHRPRRTLWQMLSIAEWRLLVFPYLLAPMLVARMIWHYYGSMDWFWLALSLIPWVVLVLWLKRPTKLVDDKGARTVNRGRPLE